MWNPFKKKKVEKTCWNCANKHGCPKAKKLNGDEEPFCVLWTELY